jgi:DNA-binding PadR family transcriptional regulator
VFVATTPGPGTVNAEALLPLPHLSYYILLAVADGPLHGWSIIRWIEDTRAGQVPSTGSLYIAILRLERQGLLEEADAPAGAEDEPRAERRRYYRITRFGREVMRAESARLSRLLEIAASRRLLPRRADRGSA